MQEIRYWNYLNANGYRLDQLVFFDEAYVDHKVGNRRYGWSLRGYRSISRSTFVRNPRYSVLAAIDMHGIIDYSVVSGSCSGYTLFYFAITQLAHTLQPYPNARSVFIMDNARIHYYRPFVSILRFLGVRVVTLPPYSPFLNPIELLFGRLKAMLKRHQRFLDEDAFLATVWCLEQLRNQSQVRAVAHCGYN